MKKLICVIFALMFFACGGTVQPSDDTTDAKPVFRISGDFDADQTSTLVHAAEVYSEDFPACALEVSVGDPATVHKFGPEALEHQWIDGELYLRTEDYPSDANWSRLHYAAYSALKERCQ